MTRMVITSSPCWLRTVICETTTPRSGLLRDRRASSTAITTCRTSPGRTGASHRSDLRARRGEARHGRDVALHEQPHHQRARVPAARDQPAERSPGGRGLVRVERLRIEAPAEREDLVALDRDRAAVHDAARHVVLENGIERSAASAWTPPALMPAPLTRLVRGDRPRGAAHPAHEEVGGAVVQRRPRNGSSAKPSAARPPGR